MNKANCYKEECAQAHVRLDNILQSLGKIACVNATADDKVKLIKETRWQFNDGWISVKDRLPASEGYYLVFAPCADPYMPFIMMAWYKPDEGWSLLNECWIKAITHWMTKPGPPIHD